MMRRRTMLAVVVALVAVGIGYLAYTQYGPRRPETVPEAVVQEQEVMPVVSVSGTVLPAKWAIVAVQGSGRIEELSVDVGQTVVAGQLLTRLDAAELQAAVSQAEAGLSVAKATLAQVRAGARAEEIAAAESAVAAATANLAAAQADLEGAGAGLAQLLAGAGEPELALAGLTVEQARNSLWGAQGQRDAVAGSDNPLIRPGDISAAEAAVSNAEVAVRMAEVERERLKAGATPEEIAVARAQVDGALARVEAVEALSAQAQSQLALLKAGPAEETVAVAEAQVQQAEAALSAARIALNRAEIRAPFFGTVGAVHVREGELAVPGQPLITLGDLNTLRVETTDLDEIDVARVAVGQRVSLTFDALPERVFTGRVTLISPMARPGGGGVNYTAVIELDEIASSILWGMTAFADIEVER
jgi:HlyD family secretion protein